MALAISSAGVYSASAEPAPGQSRPGRESTDSEVAAHFSAGQEATRAGQAERAIREYREVLRLRPDLTEARVNLGLDYFMAGQYAEASTELQRARKEMPHLGAANLFLGMVDLKLGFPAKAIPPLEEALRQDPANQDALRTLAASYLELDNYRDATKAYGKLFALNTDPVEAWYALGQHYLEMAKQLSDEISKNFPETPWEARIEGDVLAEDHKWVDAAAQYRRAVGLDERIPGLRAALGAMLLRQGKVEDAEVEFRAELRHDPDSEEALMGLAATDLGRGSVTVALENVTRVWGIFPPFLGRQTDFPPIGIETPKLTTMVQELAFTPDSPAREFLLASIYRAAGQAEPATRQWALFLKSLQAWSPVKTGASGTIEAACAGHRYAECVRRIQAQRMQSQEQNILRGKALLALGDEQTAAAAFAENLYRGSARAPSSYWLVLSYQHVALRCLSHLMELAPDSWRVHQIQGEYARSRYDYQRAVAEFTIALRARPDFADLHEQLGNAYLLNKQSAEGRAEIERALQIDPTRTLSSYLLGRVYFQDRDVPKSIEYFQAAVRFDPGFLPARAALGRAYMRLGKPAIAAPELEKAASTDRAGDLHYLLALAYRQLGKSELAAQALAVSERLRKTALAHHQAAVAAAEEELADQ
jgi:tetratricopeptide (TPR) repeat protein